MKKYLMVGAMAFSLFFNSNFSLNNEQMKLKNHQQYFNNTYKSMSLQNQRGYATSTIFNYKDEGEKSYYVGVAHAFNRKGDIALLENEINDETLEAKVDEYLRKNDIALLSGKDDNIKSPSINMISYKELIPGENAYIVGYPNGGPRCVKKTNISGWYPMNNMIYISTDEPIVGGVSGSPLFVERNDQLVLAGVMSQYNEQQITGLAVPTDYFNEKAKGEK